MSTAAKTAATAAATASSQLSAAASQQPTANSKQPAGGGGNDGGDGYDDDDGFILMMTMTMTIAMTTSMMMMVRPCVLQLHHSCQHHGTSQQPAQCSQPQHIPSGPHVRPFQLQQSQPQLADGTKAAQPARQPGPQS